MVADSDNIARSQPRILDRLIIQRQVALPFANDGALSAFHKETADGGRIIQTNGAVTGRSDRKSVFDWNEFVESAAISDAKLRGSDPVFRGRFYGSLHGVQSLPTVVDGLRERAGRRPNLSGEANALRA